MINRTTSPQKIIYERMLYDSHIRSNSGLQSASQLQEKISMKELAHEIHKNGYRYTQESKGKKAHIYRQEGQPDNDYFEVFRIRIKPAQVICVKQVPAMGIYPPDEAFGVWVWTYMIYDEAMKKFKDLESLKEGGSDD